MKPSVVARFGIVCLALSAVPVWRLTALAAASAPVALDPELVGLVRMAGETSAFLVDAQRAPYWPTVLKPDEAVLGLSLLSADLEAGVASIKRGQLIEQLRIPPPPPGSEFPDGREKAAWSFRLHRFPIEGMCRIYAMLGEAAL